jgi:hypothetical protein
MKINKYKWWVGGCGGSKKHLREIKNYFVMFCTPASTPKEEEYNDLI